MCTRISNVNNLSDAALRSDPSEPSLPQQSAAVNTSNEIPDQLNIQRARPKGQEKAHETAQAKNADRERSIKQSATTLKRFLAGAQLTPIYVNSSKLSGTSAEVEGHMSKILEKLQMVLQPDEEAAARTICTSFLQSAIDIEELLRAQREADVKYKSAIAGRNDEIREMETRIESLKLNAATKQISIGERDQELQEKSVRCAELNVDIHDREQVSADLSKQIGERQTRLSVLNKEILDVGLVCQELKVEKNDLTEKKMMLDELGKSLEISRAKLDDDRRILREAQLENHAALTSVERQRNEVQNKIASLNLSRDLLRQCVLQIAPLLLADKDPAMGTSYYESLQDIIVQKHLDLSREVNAQKRIGDQATARLNQRTAAYEEQMIKTSTLTIANESLEGQLAAALQSTKEKDLALLNLRSALESAKSNELITADIKHEKNQIKEAHERLQALHHDTKIELIDCSARLREMERNAADVEAYEDCMESLQRKNDNLEGSLTRADSELASANEALLVSRRGHNRSLELERENCSLKKRIVSLEDAFSVREVENDANIRKLTRVQDQNAKYAEALRRSHEDARIKDQTIQDGDKRLKHAFASNLKLELSLRAEKESLTLMRFKKESLDMKLSSLLAGQHPGAGGSQEAEWKMAKIRLDCLIERMQTDLAAVADAKKAWDDRVLQLRKDSRRDK